MINHKEPHPLDEVPLDPAIDKKVFFGAVICAIIALLFAA